MQKEAESKIEKNREFGYFSYTECARHKSLVFRSKRDLLEGNSPTEELCQVRVCKNCGNEYRISGVGNFYKCSFYYGWGIEGKFNRWREELEKKLSICCEYKNLPKFEMSNLGAIYFHQLSSAFPENTSYYKTLIASTKDISDEQTEEILSVNEDDLMSSFMILFYEYEKKMQPYFITPEEFEIAVEKSYREKLSKNSSA